MPSWVYYAAALPLTVLIGILIVAFIASIVDDVKSKGWKTGLTPIWFLIVIAIGLWGYHGLFITTSR